jgi:hypothetical protein
LIFTPAKITKGLAAARQSPTIQEIGSHFDRRQAPAEFWELYDQGKLE